MCIYDSANNEIYITTSIIKMTGDVWGPWAITWGFQADGVSFTSHMCIRKWRVVCQRSLWYIDLQKKNIMRQQVKLIVWHVCLHEADSQLIYPSPLLTICYLLFWNIASEIIMFTVAASLQKNFIWGQM